MLGYDTLVAILRQNNFHQYMTSERKNALTFMNCLLTEGDDEGQNELSCLELDSSRARHKKLRGVNLKNKEIYGGIAFLGTTVDTTENQIIGVIEKSELFGMKIMGKNSVELCATGLKRSLSKKT